MQRSLQGSVTQILIIGCINYTGLGYSMTEVGTSEKEHIPDTNCESTHEICRRAIGFAVDLQFDIFTETNTERTR